MKLKEAQLLGILAFIALGVIILCMWGGGRKEHLVSHNQSRATRTVQGERDLGEEVDELLRRMREQQERATQASETGEGAPGRLDFGDPAAEDTTSERDREVSDRIQSTDPEDIPVEPVKRVEGESLEVKQPSAPRVHIVQKGDTLSAISQQDYNTSSKWPFILEANKSLISDPKDLRPEMALVIPPLPEPTRPSEPRVSDVAWQSTPPRLSAEEAASGKRHYDVRAGDTLWGIAEEVYGNGTEWRKILKANSDLLDDPEDLRVNMRLVLPE